jgi:hypothetical protein
MLEGSLSSFSRYIEAVQSRCRPGGGVASGVELEVASGARKQGRLDAPNAAFT